MKGQGLFVLLAETESLAKVDFSPHILGVRDAPDSSFTEFVRGKKLVEKAQDVSGQVKVEPYIVIGSGGNHGVVRGVVQHGAHSHVELVHVGAGQHHVVNEPHPEIVGYVKKPCHIDPYGRELVRETGVEAPRIAEFPGNGSAFELRAVLVVECRRNLRFGDVSAFEKVRGKADEFRELDASGGAYLRGIGVRFGAELEIALDAKIQHFPAVEDIPVIVCELGRNPEKGRRVHGRLQIYLEPLQAGIPEGDVAVHLVPGSLRGGDVDAGEHAHIGETGVGGVDVLFIVKLPWPKDIQRLNDPRAYPEPLRLGNGEVPYGEFPVLFCRSRAVS